jgi:glycosyltransferase involved in cell wall biosynthesis
MSVGMATRVAVIVPCYNEAARFDVPAFRRFLSEHRATRMVLVNDGSTDGTLAILNALAAENSGQVHVLDLPHNGGKAEAVRKGLLAALADGAEFVAYWDADLATPLDLMKDFATITDRYGQIEVVFGSRRSILGHRVRRTSGRRLVSRICALLARIAIGLPVADTQCGAKLLRDTPALRAAIAKPFTAGWLFDVELMARISSATHDKHAAFYELPLSEWTEVPGSKVTPRAIVHGGIQMLRLIAEIRIGIAGRFANSMRPATSETQQAVALSAAQAGYRQTAP